MGKEREGKWEREGRCWGELGRAGRNLSEIKKYSGILYYIHL